MDLIHNQVVVIFLLLAILFFFFGYFALYRINYWRNINFNDCPSLKLSIIIPARNEAKNIPRLLNSISVQGYENLELIVVNDASEDNTEALACQGGATVLNAEALPPGWTGKTWALWQGANIASGVLFLFLDADTFLEENALKKILSLYQSTKSVISFCPYHRVKKRHEEFSAYFNIAMHAGVNAFSFFSSIRKKSLLFGQCMLIEKEIYKRTEGHKSVKGEILENFMYSKILHQHQIPIRSYAGRGTISMQMFPGSFIQLIRGWVKAFAKGASETSGVTLILIVIWMIGATLTWMNFVLTFIMAPSFLIIAYGILYILYAMQLKHMLSQIGSFRLSTALCFPVFLMFYYVVFTYSFLLKTFNQSITWKDRSIQKI